MGRGSMGNGAGSGVSRLGLLARYDRASCSWKTAQYSLLGGLVEFSETWPRWGMMRAGVCWELTTPSGVQEIRCLITNAIASGSLVSASKIIAQGGATAAVECLRLPPPNVPNGGRSIAHVTEWTEGGSAYVNGKKVQVGLESVLRCLRLPTPLANDAEKRGEFDLTNPRNGLPAAVKALRLPTPMASEARLGFQDRSNGKKGTQLSLTTVIQGAPADQAGGPLNPEFVEWLMGWPVGWTDLQALATARFRRWWRLHGMCCRRSTLSFCGGNGNTNAKEARADSL